MLYLSYERFAECSCYSWQIYRLSAKVLKAHLLFPAQQRQCGVGTDLIIQQLGLLLNSSIKISSCAFGGGLTVRVNRLSSAIAITFP